MEIAKELYEQNVSISDIWQMTGWYKTEDGWKTEISDGSIKDLSKLSFTDVDYRFDGNVPKVKLSDIYENKELYRMYENLSETSVVFFRNETKEELMV